MCDIWICERTHMCTRIASACRPPAASDTCNRLPGCVSASCSANFRRRRRLRIVCSALIGISARRNTNLPTQNNGVVHAAIKFEPRVYCVLCMRRADLERACFAVVFCGRCKLALYCIPPLSWSRVLCMRQTCVLGNCFGLIAWIRRVHKVMLFWPGHVMVLSAACYDEQKCMRNSHWWTDVFHGQKLMRRKLVSKNFSRRGWI